jgi:hypothetical protein
MSGISAFLVAVGVVSLACFGLMMRADRLRNRRRAYADASGGDTSSFSSTGDGFSLLNWFGGGSASSDNGCTPSSYDSSSADSGCSDGGGGGDSGGGGDGGGGGGGD